ncbi:hypothetical protein YC2023_065266 [Brassica napus]
MQISKLKSKLNGDKEEEEENNAVMMESELSVKEEEVLLPGRKRVMRRSFLPEFISDAPSSKLSVKLEFFPIDVRSLFVDGGSPRTCILQCDLRS